MLDAVDPEVYRYDELVRLLRAAAGSHSAIVHPPPSFVSLAAGVLGHLVGDVVLTWDEITGLMSNLLVSGGPPTAATSFRAWLDQHKDSIGTQYASELKRHYRPR